jgi:hypothetical protein
LKPNEYGESKRYEEEEADPPSYARYRGYVVFYEEKPSFDDKCAEQQNQQGGSFHSETIDRGGK